MDHKSTYLSYVSPTQINFQMPDDTGTGTVRVVATAGGTANSTVTLAPFAPSFSLLDATHVADIILRSDGSSAYGGGSYNIVGPAGTSLGYKTVAVEADPTSPMCKPQPVSGNGQCFGGVHTQSSVVISLR